jgi:hypothetical protein
MLWTDNGSTTFEQPPAGTHVARCVRLVDLGVQKSDYQGEISYRRQVWVAWELPTERMTEGEFVGEPFLVSRFYTQSLHPKSKLRQDLASWRGRDFTDEELQGFDPKSILGKGCLLSVIIGETGRARVSGIMALPKGTPLPEQVTPSLYFSLDEDYDPEAFEALSKGIRAIVERSPEYQAKAKPAPRGFTTPGQAEAKAASLAAVTSPTAEHDWDEEDIPF